MAGISMQAKDTAPKPVSPFSPSHYLTWAFISMAALGASAALPQCSDVLRTVFLLASTCKGYLLGVALPPALKALLHPIATCTLYTTACCHLWASVSGSTYAAVLEQFMARVCPLPPLQLLGTPCCCVQWHTPYVARTRPFISHLEAAIGHGPPICGL